MAASASMLLLRRLFLNEAWLLVLHTPSRRPELRLCLRQVPSPLVTANSVTANDSLRAYVISAPAAQPRCHCQSYLLLSSGGGIQVTVTGLRAPPGPLNNKLEFSQMQGLICATNDRLQEVYFWIYRHLACRVDKEIHSDLFRLRFVSRFFSFNRMYGTTHV